MKDEKESNLSTKCVQLKMRSKDGKLTKIDTLDTEGICILLTVRNEIKKI